MTLFRPTDRPNRISRRSATRSGSPLRKRRPQLESLEGRVVLSTYTLSEYIFFGQHVVETINGKTTDQVVNPNSTFVVHTAAGTNTVNVLDTLASIPISVAGSGQNSVNVGDAGSVQNIKATVSVESTGKSTVSVDDSADSGDHSVTSWSDGTYGYITGLAPAAISYKYADTSGVDVDTGSGKVNVNVWATGVSTTLFNNGGTETVDVNFQHKLTFINGSLLVSGTAGSKTTLDVDDSADSALNPSIVHLTQNLVPEILGLAPVPIYYANLASLQIETGTVPQAVLVQSTLYPTTVSTGTAGDFVIVGDNDSLAGINGALTVKDPIGPSLLGIYDSADKTSHIAKLDSGELSGLAPATISFAQTKLEHLIIDGGSGADTFTVVNTPTNINNPITTLDTGGGNDTVIVQKSSGYLSLDGDTGTDTLVGPNVANTWNLVTFNDSVGNVHFSNVENLTGGTSSDQFNFVSGTGVTGKVDGGIGTNTLDYSGYGSQVTVNLATSKATATGGFANIQNVVGSAATKDTLVGPNVSNTWNLTLFGNYVGNVHFSGIENLTGGSSSDKFNILTGGVTGTVNGAGGTDTLNYTGYVLPVTVNLQQAKAPAVGSFTSIENFTGGTATDTLIGQNVASTWTVSGVNSGTVGTLSFSAFENLTGGSAGDTFKIAAGGKLSGTVDGGGGSNKLDYTSFGSPVTVNLATPKETAIGGFKNIQNVLGSASKLDTLVGANTTNTWSITGSNAGTLNSLGFSGFENLTGGTGLDMFVFERRPGHYRRSIRWRRPRLA